MHNSDGGRGTFFCWIDSQRKFHYEPESVGFHLIRYDLDRNHYLFVGNESVASLAELGNSGTSVIPRTARSDYDHCQEANELSSGNQIAALHSKRRDLSEGKFNWMRKASVGYFFHAGRALRADFSFFNPSAQSACINVWMSRVPS